MELTALPRSSQSSGASMLQGRPYTPPPSVLHDSEGASSSTTTQSTAVRWGEGEGEVVLQPEIPRRLSQALLDVVVVDSPGGTPSPSFLQPASPVPVHEEADEQEPGAPVGWHEAPAGGAVVVGQPVVAPVQQGVPVQPGALDPLPRQGLREKLAIGLKVGSANAVREVVAGSVGVATNLAVTHGVRSVIVAGGVSTGAGFAGLLAGSAVASLLAGKTISRLAGQAQLAPRHLAAAMVLASGFVPFVATGPSKAAFEVYHQFLGRLAGALVTESLMQLLDGVLPRARLVALAADPLEPAPSLGGTLWARPMGGLLFYVGLGSAIESGLGPGVASALATRGLSPAAARGAVGTLVEAFFAVWDGLTTVVATDSGNLALALEPGDVRALSRNLGRLGETLSRIADFSGARVLAGSPQDFLNMGQAMNPGDRLFEAFQVAVRHLSRLRGYLQQEGRTPAGTSNAVAADFLATHDASLGSAGAGIDIRPRQPGPVGEPDDLV